MKYNEPEKEVRSVGFWATMALTVLWMPIVMYFCGYLLKHCADAKINGWIGYRTNRSRQSREAWEFANHFAGGLWKRWSGILLAFTVVFTVALYLLGANAEIWAPIVMLLQVAVMALTIPVVEKALKKRFG